MDYLSRKGLSQFISCGHVETGKSWAHSKRPIPKSPRVVIQTYEKGHSTGNYRSARYSSLGDFRQHSEHSKHGQTVYRSGPWCLGRWLKLEPSSRPPTSPGLHCLCASEPAASTCTSNRVSSRRASPTTFHRMKALC